jgi:DNA topoisomerase-3
MCAIVPRLHGGAFGAPRKGKNNDKAHPPIHPTAFVGNLAGDEKKVYEYITRRFLACCSKDAEGWETKVDIICGGDAFHASGWSTVSYLWVSVHVALG